MSPVTLILSIACSGPSADIQELQIEVDDDVVTRVHVSWTSSEATIARVDFGVDGLDQSTPWEDSPTTEHHAVLLGLPSLTTARLRIQEQSGALGEDEEVSTGLLPSSVPAFDHEGEEFANWSLLPVSADGGDHSVLVLDGLGQVVWYDQPPTSEFGSFTAELSPDGQSIYYLQNDSVARVRLDGSERENIDLAGWDMHHDLTLLPEGGFAILGKVEGLVEGDAVSGDLLVEVDEDGQERVVWNFFDVLDQLALDAVDLKTVDTGMDFSHANSLTYDADADAYLINLARLHRLLSVDRSTGELNWYLHGAGTSGLEFQPDRLLMRTHDTDLGPEGLLVFVNNTEDDECSWVARVKLEPAFERASLLGAFDSEVCRDVFALGSAHSNDQGGALISWSTEGVLEEIDADWKSRGSISVSLGHAFGYSYPLSSLYPP